MSVAIFGHLVIELATSAIADDITAGCPDNTVRSRGYVGGRAESCRVDIIGSVD